MLRNWGIHLCSFGWGWRTWYSMTCHFNVLKIDNWCSKGHGMYYPVCEMEHIKYPLQLTERSMKQQQQVSSLITECSLTACLMPGNNKLNVLRALVNKTFSYVFLPSFPPKNEAFSWRHFKHCFKTFKTYITKHTWLVCTTTLLDIIEILSEIQKKKKKGTWNWLSGNMCVVYFRSDFLPASCQYETFLSKKSYL